MNRFFDRYIAKIINCEVDIWECFEYICDILSICIFRLIIMVALLEVSYTNTCLKNDVRASYHLEFIAVYQGKELIHIIDCDF